jgi:hypothetical protein
LSVASYDQLRTVYRMLLVFAIIGIVILAVGLVEFVYYEPPGQHSGIRAHVVGVFTYDPATGTTSGPDKQEFPRSEEFAAVVDWSSLPSSIVVDARWYDGFGDIVGRFGPGSPPDLASHMIVPVEVPKGFQHSLPGHYTFVVERIQRDLPIEVLARRIVLVDRT